MIAFPGVEEEDKHDEPKDAIRKEEKFRNQIPFEPIIKWKTPTTSNGKQRQSVAITLQFPRIPGLVSGLELQKGH